MCWTSLLAAVGVEAALICALIHLTRLSHLCFAPVHQLSYQCCSSHWNLCQIKDSRKCLPFTNLSILKVLLQNNIRKNGARIWKLNVSLYRFNNSCAFTKDTTNKNYIYGNFLSFDILKFSETSLPWVFIFSYHEKMTRTKLMRETPPSVTENYQRKQSV